MPLLSDNIRPPRSSSDGTSVPPPKKPEETCHTAQSREIASLDPPRPPAATNTQAMLDGLVSIPLKQGCWFR